MPTTPNSESSAAVANFIFRGVKRMPPPKPPRQRNRPQSLPATHVLELHAKEKQSATRGSTSSEDNLPTPRWTSISHKPPEPADSSDDDTQTYSSLREAMAAKRARKKKQRPPVIDLFPVAPEKPPSPVGCPIPKEEEPEALPSATPVNHPVTPESKDEILTMIPKSSPAVCFCSPRPLTLMKGAGGKRLGFTITGGVNVERGTAGVYVKTVLPTGVAAENGNLKEGDQIVAVNGETLHGLSHQNVVSKFTRVRNGPLILSIKSKVKLPVSSGDLELMEDDIYQVNGQPLVTLTPDLLCNYLSNSSQGANLVTHRIGQFKVLPCDINQAKRTVQYSAPYTITLFKGAGGKKLGFTVTGGVEPSSGEPGIYIKTVLPQGLAAEEGTLKEGDQILELTGQSLKGLTPSQAGAKFAEQPDGPLVLTIRSRREILVKRPIPTPVEHIFTVTLQKGDHDLGVGVASSEVDEAQLGLFVIAIAPGSPAEKEGSLHLGDEIIQVNKNVLLGVTRQVAAQVFGQLQPGPVVLTVRRFWLVQPPPKTGSLSPTASFSPERLYFPEGVDMNKKSAQQSQEKPKVLQKLKIYMSKKLGKKRDSADEEYTPNQMFDGYTPNLADWGITEIPDWGAVNTGFTTPTEQQESDLGAGPSGGASLPSAATYQPDIEPSDDVTKEPGEGCHGNAHVHGNNIHGNHGEKQTPSETKPASSMQVIQNRKQSKDKFIDIDDIHVDINPDGKLVKDKALKDSETKRQRFSIDSGSRTTESSSKNRTAKGSSAVENSNNTERMQLKNSVHKKSEDNDRELMIKEENGCENMIAGGLKKDRNNEALIEKLATRSIQNHESPTPAPDSLASFQSGKTTGSNQSELEGHKTIRTDNNRGDGQSICDNSASENLNDKQYESKGYTVSGTKSEQLGNSISDTHSPGAVSQNHVLNPSSLTDVALSNRKLIEKEVLCGSLPQKPRLSSIKSLPSSTQKISLKHSSLEEACGASDKDLEVLLVHRLPGEGLGMELSVESMDGDTDPVAGVFVESITPGGAADRATGGTRGLCVGDEILEINGTPIKEVSYNEAVMFFREMPLHMIVTVKRTLWVTENDSDKDINKNSLYRSQSEGLMLNGEQHEELMKNHEIIEVRIKRAPNESLGLSVVRSAGGTLGYYQVKGVLPSGACAREGTIRPGDWLLLFNGNNLKDLTQNECLQILRQTSTEDVITVLRPRIKREEDNLQGAQGAGTADKSGKHHLPRDESKDGGLSAIEVEEDTLHAEVPHSQLFAKSPLKLAFRGSFRGGELPARMNQSSSHEITNAEPASWSLPNSGHTVMDTGSGAHSSGNTVVLTAEVHTAPSSVELQTEVPAIDSIAESAEKAEDTLSTVTMTDSEMELPSLPGSPPPPLPPSSPPDHISLSATPPPLPDTSPPNPPDSPPPLPSISPPSDIVCPSDYSDISEIEKPKMTIDPYDSVLHSSTVSVGPPSVDSGLVSSEKLSDTVSLPDNKTLSNSTSCAGSIGNISSEDVKSDDMLGTDTPLLAVDSYRAGPMNLENQQCAGNKNAPETDIKVKTNSCQVSPGQGQNEGHVGKDTDTLPSEVPDSELMTEGNLGNISDKPQNNCELISVWSSQGQGKGNVVSESQIDHKNTGSGQGLDEGHTGDASHIPQSDLDNISLEDDDLDEMPCDGKKTVDSRKEVTCTESATQNSGESNKTSVENFKGKNENKAHSDADAAMLAALANPFEMLEKEFGIECVEYGENSDTNRDTEVNKTELSGSRPDESKNEKNLSTSLDNSFSPVKAVLPDHTADLSHKMPSTIQIGDNDLSIRELTENVSTQIDNSNSHKIQELVPGLSNSQYELSSTDGAVPVSTRSIPPYNSMYSTPLQPVQVFASSVMFDENSMSEKSQNLSLAADPGDFANIPKDPETTKTASRLSIPDLLADIETGVDNVSRVTLSSVLSLKDIDHATDGGSCMFGAEAVNSDTPGSAALQQRSGNETISCEIDSSKVELCKPSDDGIQVTGETSTSQRLNANHRTVNNLNPECSTTYSTSVDLGTEIPTHNTRVTETLQNKEITVTKTSVSLNCAQQPAETVHSPSMTITVTKLKIQPAGSGCVAGAEECNEGDKSNEIKIPDLPYQPPESESTHINSDPCELNVSQTGEVTHADGMVISDTNVSGINNNLTHCESVENEDKPSTGSSEMELARSRHAVLMEPLFAETSESTGFNVDVLSCYSQDHKLTDIKSEVNKSIQIQDNSDYSKDSKNNSPSLFNGATDEMHLYDDDDKNNGDCTKKSDQPLKPVIKDQTPEGTSSVKELKGKPKPVTFQPVSINKQPLAKLKVGLTPRTLTARTTLYNRRSETQPFQIGVLKGLLGFGITVATDDSGHVIIQDIQKSGPVGRNGCVRSGDILLSVNGQQLSGLPEVKVQHLLSTTPRGLAKLVILARLPTEDSGSCNKKTSAREDTESMDLHNNDISGQSHDDKFSNNHEISNTNVLNVKRLPPDGNESPSQLPENTTHENKDTIYDKYHTDFRQGSSILILSDDIMRVCRENVPGETTLFKAVSPKTELEKPAFENTEHDRVSTSPPGVTSDGYAMTSNTDEFHFGALPPSLPNSPPPPVPAGSPPPPPMDSTLIASPPPFEPASPPSTGGFHGETHEIARFSPTGEQVTNSHDTVFFPKTEGRSGALLDSAEADKDSKCPSTDHTDSRAGPVRLGHSIAPPEIEEIKPPVDKPATLVIKKKDQIYDDHRSNLSDKLHDSRADEHGSNTCDSSIIPQRQETPPDQKMEPHGMVSLKGVPDKTDTSNPKDEIPFIKPRSLSLSEPQKVFAPPLKSKIETRRSSIIETVLEKRRESQPKLKGLQVPSKKGSAGPVTTLPMIKTSTGNVKISRALLPKSERGGVNVPMVSTRPKSVSELCESEEEINDKQTAEKQKAVQGQGKRRSYGGGFTYGYLSGLKPEKEVDETDIGVKESKSAYSSQSENTNSFTPDQGSIRKKALEESAPVVSNRTQITVNLKTSSCKVPSQDTRYETAPSKTSFKQSVRSEPDGRFPSTRGVVTKATNDRRPSVTEIARNFESVETTLDNKKSTSLASINKEFGSSRIKESQEKFEFDKEFKTRSLPRNARQFEDTGQGVSVHQTSKMFQELKSDDPSKFRHCDDHPVSVAKNNPVKGSSKSTVNALNTDKHRSVSPSGLNSRENQNDLQLQTPVFSKIFPPEGLPKENMSRVSHGRSLSDSVEPSFCSHKPFETTKFEPEMHKPVHSKPYFTENKVYTHAQMAQKNGRSEDVAQMEPVKARTFAVVSTPVVFSSKTSHDTLNPVESGDTLKDSNTPQGEFQRSKIHVVSADNGPLANSGSCVTVLDYTQGRKNSEENELVPSTTELLIQLDSPPNLPSSLPPEAASSPPSLPPSLPPPSLPQDGATVFDDSGTFNDEAASDHGSLEGFIHMDSTKDSIDQLSRKLRAEKEDQSEGRGSMVSSPEPAAASPGNTLNLSDTDSGVFSSKNTDTPNTKDADRISPLDSTAFTDTDKSSSVVHTKPSPRPNEEAELLVSTAICREYVVQPERATLVVRSKKSPPSSSSSSLAQNEVLCTKEMVTEVPSTNLKMEVSHKISDVPVVSKRSVLNTKLASAPEAGLSKSSESSLHKSDKKEMGQIGRKIDHSAVDLSCKAVPPVGKSEHHPRKSSSSKTDSSDADDIVSRYRRKYKLDSAEDSTGHRIRSPQTDIIGGTRSRSPIAAVSTKSSSISKASPSASGPQEEITFTKGAVGLGFCIEGGAGSPLGDRPITVKRLFRGSAAQGILNAGDEIMSANGKSYQGINHYHAWNHLKGLPEGPVHLVIRRKIKE